MENGSGTDDTSVTPVIGMRLLGSEKSAPYVGDTVHIRWRDKKVYKGTVQSITAQTVSVRFEDGSYCDRISRRRIVPQPNTSAFVRRSTRKRKARDFFACMVVSSKRKYSRNHATAWRALQGNPKTAINAYLCKLAGRRRVFTLEDPEKWRTTEMLRAAGAQVVALSTNPKIKERGHVCEFSTPYLARVDKAHHKPSVCWLDYCGSCRRSHTKFDWIEDLQHCLEWLRSNGVVMLTFMKRGVANFTSFVLQQIARHTPHARCVDMYEYTGENDAAMCVFTVVQGKPPALLLSVYMTPLPGSRVRVQDHTGVWEGVVHKQYTPNEFEVRTAEERCTVLRKELTHVAERRTRVF